MHIPCKNFLFMGLLALLCLAACNPKDHATTAPTVANDSIAVWMQQGRNTDLPKAERRAYWYKVLARSESLADTARTKVLSRISLNLKRLRDDKGFLQTNDRLRQLAQKIGDYQSLGEAYWDLGFFYRQISPDSAYYYYQEAHTTFLRADLDSAGQGYPGRILYAMARVKSNNKDYVGAEREVVSAIQFYKENQIDDRLFDAYNLLAIVQGDLNNFKKALEYHQTAQQYIGASPTSNIYRETVFNEINIAGAHVKNGDIQKGLQLFEKVLQTDSLKVKQPQSYAKLLASIADARLQAGHTDAKVLKQLLNESNRLLDSIGDTYHQARNQEFLADILIRENDTAQAIGAALKGKGIAEATNNNDRLLSTLQLLTRIDRPNSAEHARAYFTLNDSLQTQERNIRDKFARIEMETDEILEENEALARQRRLLIWVIAGSLILAMAIFIIIAQRVNNQKLRFNQAQQENDKKVYGLMLEQQGKFQEGKQLEQKRVSQELHDGILGQMLGIRLILSGLNEQNDEASIAHRAELLDKLQELEEEIRTISHELNDASYQKIHNFMLAIEDLVSEIGDTAQWKSTFDYDQEVDWDGLAGDTKINLYRIVQECLQNCVKHAHCDHVSVQFQNGSNGELKLMIHDNGKGFDQNRSKKGIGLRNIVSRVKQLSGELHIDSAPGKGTKIQIQLPKQNEKPIRVENSKGLLGV